MEDDKILSVIQENEDINWTEEELKKKEKCDKKFEKQKKKALFKFEERKHKKELKEINETFREHKISSFLKVTSTKLFMYYILINCTVIEVYSMYVMYHFNDLTALYSLIGAVVGESIAFTIYCAKSYHENKSEHELEFEKEKFEHECEIEEENITSEEREGQIEER